ncbi:MAG: type II toxin-antitoxin system PemK/MazF family toxin [Sporichthyaceae bacterium]
MTAPPLRGEIWLTDFGTPIGHEQGDRRPAVVMSADRMNASRAGLVIVVPMTTTRRSLPTHIEVESGPSGLTETSYAKAEDIKSVSVARLVHRIGRAPSADIDRIKRAVGLLLEF